MKWGILFGLAFELHRALINEAFFSCLSKREELTAAAAMIFYYHDES
jgi:hypothetical protein